MAVRKKPTSAACARLVFDTWSSSDDGHGMGEISIYARDPQRPGITMGNVEAWTSPDIAAVNVSEAEVDPSLQRCGVGTKLYELAATEACKKFGKPLASDTKRSAMSHGFWIKQVKKRRAVCVRDAEPMLPGTPDWKSVPGRGNCLRYVLKSCKVRTLSGRRSRR